VSVTRETKEAEEVKELKESARKQGGVAAFFDLDGTLLPGPSLEQRFFLALRFQRAIPKANYFLWLAETMRLAPRGIGKVRHANKLYLRGLAVNSAEKHGPETDLAFFPLGIEQIAWHVRRGHDVLVVSGTLEPLALQCVRAIEKVLAKRGVAVRISVIATRLEERGGGWTGRLLGEAMFGPAKARALARIASERRLRLETCYAYGDGELDRWMLGSVGRPAAVNAQPALAKIAALHGWPMMEWRERENPAPRNTERGEIAEMKSQETFVA
jgi:HAD superfamily phosphoserine phosphatase-like hydrolase